MVQMFPLLPGMQFRVAASNFLEGIDAPVPHDKARYKAFRTVRDYKTKLKALTKFFGELELQEIHLGHFRAYQKERLTNPSATWAHEAGPRKVNAELGLVERFLRLSGCWTPELERYYNRLIEDEAEIPRALDPDEQEHFLATAESNPDWHIVWWYSLLALHTGFSSDELRTLRQGDVNVRHQILAVNRRHGKNKWRRREIPIADSRCLWALERLMDRSIELVGRSPEMHLFPARISRGNFDGARHMSDTGIRKQFDAARKAAGLPWFPQNGWRHTAITRFAEAGIPIATIMARAGHCSPKMTAHYTHISIQAERMAMQSMERVAKKGPISIGAIKTRKAIGGY
jgi:integrase